MTRVGRRQVHHNDIRNATVRGSDLNNLWSASTPPAEAPTPTIGNEGTFMVARSATPGHPEAHLL